MVLYSKYLGGSVIVGEYLTLSTSGTLPLQYFFVFARIPTCKPWSVLSKKGKESLPSLQPTAANLGKLSSVLHLQAIKGWSLKYLLAVTNARNRDDPA